MGLSNFFKKKKPILNDSDNLELREIQRKVYLEEAKKLIEEQSRQKARNDFGIKQKKESIF
jgi:hypothetical protein